MMWTRRIVGSALMLGSVALIALTYRFTSHRDDLIFYTVFAIAAATFTTALFGGWAWNGILGDKRKSLAKLYSISLLAFLILGSGPLAAAAILGKGSQWADAWRYNLLMIAMAWNVIWTCLKRNQAHIKVH